MLQLGSGMQTIGGITVFPDHNDDKLRWYLPAPVRIARRREDDHPLFSLIKYRPAAVEAGAEGGGFVAFTVALGLSEIEERRLRARLGSDVRLAAVPFDEGTVECVALNLQGPGGTTAQIAANGSFNAMEQILGSASPSNFGEIEALFSLQLSREGATLLEQAFAKGMTPIGVIYRLGFTALRPALDVKITANLERVYQQFSLGAKANIYWVRAAIDAGFEQLVQTGAIKIESTNFSTDADKSVREDWALQFFKEDLLSEWFTPTLAPGAFRGAATGGVTLPGVPALPGQPPKAGGSGAASGGSAGGGAAGAGPSANPAARPASAVPAHKLSGAAPAAPAAGGAGKPGAGAPQPGANPGTSVTTTPDAGKPDKPATNPPKGGGAPSPSTDPKSPDTGVTVPGGDAALVTVQLKAIRQEERKTLTFEYHSSEAVQRTYAPQALFGLLAADLDRDDVITHVNLGDTFFRHLAVDVEVPGDFSRIGLASVTAALDYGDPADPANHTRADLVFSAEDPAPQRFETFLNEHLDLSYDRRIEFRFRPESGWRGERNEYVLEPGPTTDRTLLLDPFAHLGFLEVRVFPNRIDAGAIASTDVHLVHTEPGGWTARDMFTVVPGGEEQVWRVRTGAPDRREYEYTLRHHLTNGTTRTVGPVTSSATILPIDDPFRSRIEPRFVFQVPEGEFESASLKVTYEDGDYVREEHVEVNGGVLGSTRLRIATLNPRKRTYTVRATLIGTDNRIVRGAPTTTDADIVGINELAEVV